MVSAKSAVQGLVSLPQQRFTLRGILPVSYSQRAHLLANRRMFPGVRVLKNPEVASSRSETVKPAFLRVFDVTDPTSPTIVGEVITQTGPRDIVLEGDYAYLSGDTWGLQIADISDPAAPCIVGLRTTCSVSDAV